MVHTKKVNLCIILGIVICIVSLASSIGALNKSYSSSFVSNEVDEKYVIGLYKVTDIYTDDNINVLNNPIIKDYSLIYGVELLNLNGVAKFQFNLKNTGNIAAKVKNIEIYGYEDYKDYVKIEIDGLKVGDIIEEDSIIKKINVYTSYENPYYDLNGLIKNITLKDLKIVISFEDMKDGLDEEE